MAEKLIEDGVLTKAGTMLASKMFNLQCDRIPCAMCSKQNRESRGPGGPGCPAANIFKERSEVDGLLEIYIGKAPEYEALTSFLEKLH